MTIVNRTRMAASALAGLTAATAGAAIWTSQAHAADGYHDAAYGISATGAAPIGATPAVTSSDGRLRSDSGGAASSDGTVSIKSASVSAGGGKATVTVTGFSAFDGLVSASTVKATCSNGDASSQVDGTPAGRLGKKGTVAYDVRTKNSNGSTTVIGMQVRISGGAGVEAATINVASATCAAPPASPEPTDPSATTKPTTGAPTRTASPEPTKPTSTPKPGGTTSTVEPAPAPTPKVTHVPVTG